MSEVAKRNYRIVMSGDAVEAVIAPLSAEQVDYWSNQPGEILFQQTFLTPEGEVNPAVPADRQLPGWRDFPDTIYLEGVELGNGSIDVFDEDGDVVYSDSMETPEFWDAYVDDYKKYDNDEEGLRSTEAAHVGTISYTGKCQCDLLCADDFDRDLLMLFVSKVPGLPPFVSKIIYDGQVLSNGGGTGKYLWQSASVYVDGKRVVNHYVKGPAT